jgi:hypothetical protein
MTDKKMPEPMDAGAPERDSAEPVANSQRPCYAAKQLVKEVLDLFPVTSYEISNYNGRSVGLAVKFTPAETDSDLIDLLTLLGDSAYNEDPRVNLVAVSNGSVTVDFHNRPRTYDIKDTFGLEDAWLVLAGDEYEGGDAFDTSDDEQDGGSA